GQVVILCGVKLKGRRADSRVRRLCRQSAREGPMELREALTQISEIRRQVARTELFRGYRAFPVAFSGLLALAAAGFQQWWLPDPAHNVPAYLALWIGAALISVLATGMEMALYYRRCGGSSLAWQTTWLAIGQFLPCLAAGGLLTFVVAAH